MEFYHFQKGIYIKGFFILFYKFKFKKFFSDEPNLLAP
jgi:hypothetical protein